MYVYIFTPNLKLKQATKKFNRDDRRLVKKVKQKNIQPKLLQEKKSNL